MKILVNFCDMDEMKFIPGIGHETASRLMRIREEGGHISLAVLEAVTRRRYSETELQLLDFTPSGLSLASRGTAPASALPVNDNKAEKLPRLQRELSPIKKEQGSAFEHADQTVGAARMDHTQPDLSYMESTINTVLHQISKLRGPSGLPRGGESLSAGLTSCSQPDSTCTSDSDHVGSLSSSSRSRIRVPPVARSRVSKFSELSSSEESEAPARVVRKKTKSSTPKTGGMAALRSLPKTMVFDGDSNWQAFQLKFTKYAESSGWTQDECRDCLFHSLTGKALTHGAMLLQRDPNLPYRKMLRKLEKRFDPKELPAAAQTKFNQATQRKGESIEEWADRVQTMATVAFRELPEDYCNQQVLTRFTQGLLDTEAGHSVFMKAFSNIDDAINEVHLFQHSKRAMGHSKKQKSPTSAVDYESDDVLQVSAVEKSKPSLESMLEQMQQELKEVKLQLSQRQSFRGRGRGRGAGRGQPRGRCFLCNEEGHYHRDCPLKQSLNMPGSEMGVEPRPNAS